LEHSSSAADIKFVQELDEMRRKEMKTFLLIYTKGKSEWIERIEKADSLIAMQQIFIEAMNEEPTLKATISSPPEHCN
jgi:hypothetical protein